MNCRQYTAAVGRLLDVDNPDVHIEMMLLFGPAPEWSTDEYMDWANDVKKHLQTRYHWPTTQSAKRKLNIAVNVIEKRIWNEQAKAGRTPSG